VYLSVDEETVVQWCYGVDPQAAKPNIFSINQKAARKKFG